jgi:O-antigen/teichoic acid export membrane protein
VLGTYAVASKYAELLRLPGTALTWVAYPELARSDAVDAARRTRRLLRPALLSVWGAAVPMLVLTGPVVQLLYGRQFSSAVPQARVLLVGMLIGGGAGLASGYLYGRGRPGLNSLGLGIGLALTVILDITLIPHHGAMGAAIASTVAYLVADSSLVLMLLRTSRSDLSVADPVAAPVEATP